VRGTLDGYIEAKQVMAVEEQSGRLESYTDYTLYLAAGGTVTPGDKVESGGLTYYAGGVVEGKTRRAFLATKLTLEATGG
jgi:hypothetical protein